VGLFRALGRRQIEFLDAITDLIAIQAEQRRRAGLVPVAARERLNHQPALDLIEVDASYL
jgi:hypothetical protein